jgi:hypothetical protein
MEVMWKGLVIPVMVGVVGMGSMQNTTVVVVMTEEGTGSPMSKGKESWMVVVLVVFLWRCMPCIFRGYTYAVSAQGVPKRKKGRRNWDDSNINPELDPDRNASTDHVCRGI